MMQEDITKSLRTTNWDFKDSETNTLTHGIHPYPAKFIPQIPRHLIQAFTETGDRVLDPFCGSGTALAEAILLDRCACGIDINPLSTLIAKVKATPLPHVKFKPVNDILYTISQELEILHGRETLFNTGLRSDSYPVPDFPKLRFWFKDFVIIEAAIIKHNIFQVKDDDLRDFLKVAFSSILVTVSNQDSDTRYTRRDKKINPGDTVSLFARRTKNMMQHMNRFYEKASERRPVVKTGDSQVVDKLVEENTIDFIVTSPPYPNAFTYHLYHRNRMFWLDLDPYPVKSLEIGSHRKYSKKNGATAETFKGEMEKCFRGFHSVLKPGGYCCIVIGDSIIRGKLVHNNEILKEVAVGANFAIIDDIKRSIQVTRKAFNPKIGRIKEESILVLKSKKT